MSKILIIRFSSIGDIVLTTPIIRCLKKQLPNGTEVHYLTKKKYQNLLDQNPYIDQIHTIESKVSEVKSELQKHQFDFVVDLHNNLRSRQVKQTLKVRSGTLDKKNIAKWLIVNFKIDQLPDEHIVDRYLTAASELGIKNDNQGLDLFVPSETKFDWDSLPENFNDQYAVFAIGGTRVTKRMPDSKIIELLRKVSCPVILIGGKEDIDSSKNIATRFPKNEVLNLCGKLSIMQSAMVMERAAKVIAHDTGMMHIASALDKTIISIWGNTIPKFGMSPYQPAQSKHEQASQIFEVEDLRCRPCSKLGFGKCPKKHFYCMNLQEIDSIAAAIDR